jgi:colanic acid biosynthesis protein WcaH
VNIQDAVVALDAHVKDPRQGLPDDVFYYISRTTPLVNVDLLIKDERGRTLLSWRDDPYCGRGWHVPGGIVRFQEDISTRIRKVAAQEIKAEVAFEEAPIAVHELIHPDRRNRSHFISLLYKCSLPPAFVPANLGVTEKEAGFLAWHEGCPQDLIKVHDIYRKYIQ